MRHRAVLFILSYLFFLMAPFSAEAVTLEGHFILSFTETNNSSSGFNLWFGNKLTDNPAEFELSFDKDAGTATLTADLSGYAAALGDRDASNVLEDSIGGQLQIEYSNLTFEIDPTTGQEVVFIGREGTSAIGTLTTDVALLGGTQTIFLGEKFIDIGNANHGFWNEFGLAPFTVLFGAAPGTWANAGVFAGDAYFSTWLMGNSFSLNGIYDIKGDIHAEPVPEPGTILLMSAGLLGHSLRRRKSAS